MIVTVVFEAGHKKMIWAKKNVFGLKKSLFGQSGPWNYGKLPFLRFAEKRKTGRQTAFFNKEHPKSAKRLIFIWKRVLFKTLPNRG